MGNDPEVPLKGLTLIFKNKMCVCVCFDVGVPRESAVSREFGLVVKLHFSPCGCLTRLIWEEGHWEAQPQIFWG